MSEGHGSWTIFDGYSVQRYEKNRIFVKIFDMNINKGIIVAIALVLCLLDPNKALRGNTFESAFDTIIKVNDHFFKIKYLSENTFKELQQKHLIEDWMVVVSDIEQIQRLLGPRYTLDITVKEGADGHPPCYVLKEIRPRTGQPIVITKDSLAPVCLMKFFPKERILLCENHIGSDQAFYLDTWETAYNPELSSISPDGLYRIEGLYNGTTDRTNLLVGKKENDGTYHWMVSFSQFPIELRPQYLNKDVFWIERTLYYPVGWWNMDEDGKNKWEVSAYVAMTFPD